MIRKITAVFSMVIGISVIGMWIMIISTGGINEGTIEISFHILSEILMAIFLLLAGVGLLGGKRYGNKVFLTADGMLIYSALNAAGYYGQSSNFAMFAMFISIFIISSTLFILMLAAEKRDAKYVK